MVPRAGLGSVVEVNFSLFGSGCRKIGFPDEKGVYPEPGRRRLAQQILRLQKIFGRVAGARIAVL